MKSKFSIIILILLCSFKEIKGQSKMENSQIENSKIFYSFICKGQLNEGLKLLDSSSQIFNDTFGLKSGIINTRKELWCFDSLKYINASHKVRNGKKLNVYEFKLLSSGCLDTEKENNSISFLFNENSHKIFYFMTSKTTKVDNIDIVSKNPNTVNISSDTVIRISNEEVKILKTGLLNLSLNEAAFNIIIQYTLPTEQDERESVALNISKALSLLYIQNKYYEMAKSLSLKTNKFLKKNIIVTFYDGSRSDYNVEIN